MAFSRIACLSLALAVFSAESARLKKAMQSKGPHKCTISWPGRGNGKPATASFGVSSCIIKCKLSNGDSRPEKMYPSGFQAVQHKRTCGCQTTEGRELFKFEGLCGDEASVKAKCFDMYTRMMTDEYKTEYGRETLAVFHHPKLHGDNTFDYTNCEQNACDGDECTEHYLPSLWDSRTDKEKKLLAELIKKAATGGKKDLTSQQKTLLRSLGKGDVEQAAIVAKEDATADVAEQIQELFLRVENDVDLLSPDESPKEKDPITIKYEKLVTEIGDGFTVKDLKDHYKVLFEDTGMSVDHIAIVAGLTDDDKVVTEEDLKAFLNPEC